MPELTVSSYGFWSAIFSWEKAGGFDAYYLALLWREPVAFELTIL